MELVKQWSAMKRTILNSPAIRHQPVQEGYEEVFKLFDQKLSKKLKEVEAAAAKSPKKEDEASRDTYLGIC